MSLSIAVALPIIVSLLACICCFVDYNKDRNVMQARRNLEKQREEEEIRKLNAELDEMDEFTNNLKGEIELLDTKQEKLEEHMRGSQPNSSTNAKEENQKIIVADDNQEHLDNDLRLSAQKQR